MAVTLRLGDADSLVLRTQAEREEPSMRQVAKQAIADDIEQHGRAELLIQVLDTELPRYAEALRRLADA